MKKEPQVYIDKALKPPKSFFDWCYSQIHTFKWSNKQQTILASDRKNCYVIEKRLNRRSNLTFFDKEYYFAITLVTATRIEIQSYRFVSKVDNGHQIIREELSNFEQYANNEHIKISPSFYGKYFYGLTPNREFMGGAYTGTMFYENDWKEKIQTISELKYLEFDRLSLFDLEHIYKYKNEIEFLQKIKAERLAYQLMYHTDVDMRIITNNWLKKNKQFFKKSNRGFGEFEFEKRVKERNGKVVPGIEQYLSYRDINKIPKGVGITRFQNWIIKNKVDFRYYKDYIGMLRDLNLDPIGNENLIIPKDLVKAHDNAVELINQMNAEKHRIADEKREKAYQEVLEKRLKLEKQIDGFNFVIPKKISEIITEGKELHHCVGSSGYVDQHEKGKLTIVFIRLQNEVNKPFYTLEFKGNRVVQVRGKHNIAATEEINKAVEHWLECVTNEEKRTKYGKKEELKQTA